MSRIQLFFGFVSVASVIFYIRSSRFRIIKLESPWECLFWTVRAALWQYPWPKDELEWKERYDDLLYKNESIKGWNFLRPFFASRGYYLYKTRQGYHMLPSTDLDVPNVATTHPYARRLKGMLPEFHTSTPRVWAAQDTQGREVIIKAVSSMTNELKVLEYLNSPELRVDRRNHTIHVIEVLHFDSAAFVIMPRWDMAFMLDFHTVSELMYMTKSSLETFDLLHEHRIIHCDFLEQNMGLNIVLDKKNWPLYIHGLRDPPDASYALYDFEASHIFPSETSLDDCKWDEDLNFRIHHMPTPEGSYNPFKADIGFTGAILQLRVRHIENIIPELGPFFDGMTDKNEQTRFSAREALQCFMKIYNGLTSSQLQQEVTTWLYRRGKAEKRPPRPAPIWAEIY